VALSTARIRAGHFCCKTPCYTPYMLFLLPMRDPLDERSP